MGKHRIHKLKKAAAALITGCFLFAAVFPAVGEESVSASNMRLSYTEGNVKVYGGGGKEASVIKDMRLHSGYSLSTELDSYAGILLDESRVVKMDALSKGELRKKGKKLELLLSKGGLLCDVEKPLEADETLNIRTATMITGIRGTVLFVRAIDQYTSMVYVMEGSVALRGTNPNTGGEKTEDITQGQKGIVTAGGERLEGQDVIVETGGFTKEEIPGYVLMAVAGDSNLAGRLRAAGWDVDWMIANASRRLLEDQKADEVRASAGNMSGSSGGKTLVDQMYQDSGSDSGSSGGSAGIERYVVEWSDDINAASIQEWLQNHQKIVIILPIGVISGTTELESMTIPAGRHLEFGPGIDVKVLSGYKLTVRGSLHISGNLEVEAGGALDNTGSINVGGNTNIQSASGNMIEPELSTPSTAMLANVQLSPDTGVLLEEEEKTNKDEPVTDEEILDSDEKTDSGEILDEDGLLSGDEINNEEDQTIKEESSEKEGALAGDEIPNEESQPAKGEIPDEDGILSGDEIPDEENQPAEEGIPDEDGTLTGDDDIKLLKKEEKKIEEDFDGNVQP